MDPSQNTPWLYRMPVAKHYYGDIVRQLLLAAAVIMLIGAPFYADDISQQAPELTIASIVLAIVSWVMTPQMRLAKFGSVLVSLVGGVIFELWALAAFFGSGTFTFQFLVRQVIAVVFFIALYLSIKTSRADRWNTRASPLDDEDFDPDEAMSKIDREIGDADDSLVSGNV